MWSYVVCSLPLVKVQLQSPRAFWIVKNPVRHSNVITGHMPRLVRHGPFMLCRRVNSSRTNKQNLNLSLSCTLSYYLAYPFCFSFLIFFSSLLFLCSILELFEFQVIKLGQGISIWLIHFYSIKLSYLCLEILSWQYALRFSLYNFW